MNAYECAKALGDMLKLYDLNGDKATTWTALVMKACGRMPAEQFKAVADRLFETAGRFKPTNEDFWRVWRELAAERNWNSTRSDCQTCFGSGFVSAGEPGLYIRHYRWAEFLTGPALDIVQETGRPCECNHTPQAARIRASFEKLTTEQGWVEITFKEYMRTLEARRRAMSPVRKMSQERFRQEILGRD